MHRLAHICAQITLAVYKGALRHMGFNTLGMYLGIKYNISWDTPWSRLSPHVEHMMCACCACPHPVKRTGIHLATYSGTHLLSFRGSCQPGAELARDTCCQPGAELTAATSWLPPILFLPSPHLLPKRKPHRHAQQHAYNPQQHWGIHHSPIDNAEWPYPQPGPPPNHPPGANTSSPTQTNRTRSGPARTTRLGWKGTWGRPNLHTPLRVMPARVRSPKASRAAGAPRPPTWTERMLAASGATVAPLAHMLQPLSPHLQPLLGCRTAAPEVFTVPHLLPWSLKGIPGNPRDFPAWNFLGISGNLGIPRDSPGILYGIAWECLELLGNPWDLEIPRESIWNSLEVPEIPWDFLGFSVDSLWILL
ncbi:hypothetical protein BD779DRAFT_1475618 [Infundibulicybe gibba]|nr:hypothetical protein BD779DRAFT_1475618 [Infundibulicybe gibba]